MLCVQALGADAAYAARINERMALALGKPLNTSALYHTLADLEEVGYLGSRQEGRTGSGGPARRFYRVTADGGRALRSTEEARRIARGQKARPPR